MSSDDQTVVRRLATDVIAVAMAGSGYDWAAYIGSVQKTEEYMEAIRSVQNSGCKLPQKVAEAIFPEFARKFKWRR